MKVLAAIVVLGLIATAAAYPRSLKHWSVRIVGGEETAKNELPYQVSLRWFGGHICGGSILNANYIITAAHCAVAATGVSSFSIAAGEHDISSDTNDGTEQIRAVKSKAVHPQYDDFLLTNDIAVMELSAPLELNSVVAAVTLPSSGFTASGDALVSGWGTLREGGQSPDKLHKVTVPIISDNECRAAYGDNDVYDSMICAGLPEGGKDSCQGDSGGPLTSNGGLLTGIVSWGIGCARPGYPGVYTEVSYFIDWIQQETS